LNVVKKLDEKSFVSAIRDISKKREKVYCGNINDVMTAMKEDGLEESPHGEWVVIISKKN